MNEIKITTELCAEDRKRLEDLAQAMGFLAGQLSLLVKGAPYGEATPAEAFKPKAEKPSPDPIDTLPEEVMPAEAEDHPVENPFTEAEKEKAPAVPPVTKDDVRKLFVNLAASGKKEQARDIVTTFANSITDLPDEIIAEVYVKLAALGA